MGGKYPFAYELFIKIQTPDQYKKFMLIIDKISIKTSSCCF